MSFSVMLQQLAGGMLVSIEIFFVTLLFSLPLGLLICFGRMSRNKVIRTIVSGYISIMRGTPLMLQLMVVYFGPYFIFGIRISMGYSLIAVFIAFAINYAPYCIQGSLQLHTVPPAWIQCRRDRFLQSKLHS